MNGLVPVLSLQISNPSPRITIKDGYDILFPPEFAKAQTITLTFFSTEDMADPRLTRKYIRPISSRAYYPDGRKRWFYKLMHYYEMQIPKECLILDPEKSGSSYIYYTINGVDIINNTSGGSGGASGNWTDWQRDDIHHCRIIKRKAFKSLCDVAVIPEYTSNEAEEPFYLDFSAITILMIEKYANGLTNYSKTYKQYHRFRYTGSALMDFLLTKGFSLSKRDYEDIWKSFKSSDYSGKDLDVYMDFLNWRDQYDVKEFKAIPQELYEAFNNLKNMNWRKIA